MTSSSPTDKTLLQILDKVTGSGDGESDGKGAGTTKTDGSAVVNPLGLLEMVKAALDRYRSTVTWIVTAYAAVWAVLVGTAPFAGLGDLSFLEQLVAGLGLFLAGLGAILGIYAASRVLEPEDASLGELTRREGPSQTQTTGFNPVAWGRSQLAERVEREATATMWKLFYAERKGYFGPDAPDDPVGTPEELGRKWVGQLITRLDVQSEIVRSCEVRAAGIVDPEQRKDADAQAAAARVDFDASLARRERTLAVAVTYQVRGKYLSSRRMLLLGALLVLVGTLFYLLQVSAETDDDDSAVATAVTPPQALTPVSIRLQPATWIELETTAGKRGCLGASNQRDRTLSIAGYARGTVDPKGPWEVIVPPSGPTCRPIEFTLKLPDGRVVAAS